MKRIKFCLIAALALGMWALPASVLAADLSKTLGNFTASVSVDFAGLIETTAIVLGVATLLVWGLYLFSIWRMPLGEFTPVQNSRRTAPADFAGHSDWSARLGEAGLALQFTLIRDNAKKDDTSEPNRPEQDAGRGQ